MEFGLVASINVMATYVISLVMIPIVFSFLPNPDTRHTRHLSAPRLNKLLEMIDYLVHRYYRVVFAIVLVIIAVSCYGLTKISTVGYVVDDIPKNDPVYVDMRYFERALKVCYRLNSPLTPCSLEKFWKSIICTR
jgi:predicted RND superfamily exporter protein